MLYYINESVAALAQQQDQIAIKVLEELLLAWKRNKCLIDASRTTFEMLCTIERLTEYSAPFSRKQGVIPIYSNLSFFVQLAADGDNDVKNFQNAQGRILSINKDQDLFFFSTNYIICENSHDYGFYCWGANQFQDSETKRIIKLNTTRANGAGSQINYECELVNREPKFGLVIYDSDMNYNRAPIGKTAESIDKKLRSLHPNYLWSHMLSTHEIENLIPIQVLIGLRIKQHKTFLANMDKNKLEPMFDLLFKYFDFKKGFPPSTLRAYMNSLPSADFDNLISLLKKMGVRKDSIDKALKNTWSKKNKENVLLGGWGDKLLQQSLAYVNNNENTNYSLLNYQQNEWNVLVKDIWSIGCAYANHIM